MQEITEAVRHHLQRIDLLGLAFDDGVDGLAFGIDGKSHFIAETFVDICPDIAVRSGPFQIDFLVEVLVGVFPDGIVTKVAGNLARLHLKRGRGELRRRFYLKVILLAGGQEDKSDDDRNRDKHDACHRNDDPLGKILAGKLRKLRTKNPHLAPPRLRKNAKCEIQMTG